MTHIESLRQQLHAAIASGDKEREAELREQIQLHEDATKSEQRNIDRLRRERDEDKNIDK